MVILPGASGPTVGDPDMVRTIPVILAGLGETALPDLMRRALAAPDTLVAIICVGGLALGMAGLLEGRAAVTHTQGNNVLEATGTTVVRARVVDDGDLASAGGVTSGLDLALHLLEREFGPRIALAVEKLFGYERRGIVWAARGPEALALGRPRPRRFPTTRVALPSAASPAHGTSRCEHPSGPCEPCWSSLSMTER
ncbi:DJ-1/PfpI family protein [Frigoribacterium sp. CFBP 13712]|uniref:DJ-1/PfpI family protein n=1 Tax=Frigoribacterium sp. CFBP 13712 TaxID=2775309 RepID=UPI0018D6DE98|nr:DJ-1/PfpI family protein [Frigoribacterium sp. CFBP 13712]